MSDKTSGVIIGSIECLGGPLDGSVVDLEDRHEMIVGARAPLWNDVGVVGGYYTLCDTPDGYVFHWNTSEVSPR